MEEKDFKNKLFNATIWSSTTEILARIIAPLTNIILARIVSPEAFGIVATITMIISFADIFADSGFQKYLIQHEFRNKVEKYKNANVAFWTNLLISIILLIFIFVFQDQIAALVGSPGLGNVLVIASLQLPITSFSSIQMALFKRDFKFKTLFFIRMISVIIPIVITIPLAMLGISYWALIIGNMTMQLSNAILLTLKSSWKPKFTYSFTLLKEMLSFSAWTLIEALSIWLTTWVDTFIIGRYFNQHQVGLYKTSTSMVSSLMALVTGSIVPVLFSSLSRVQNNQDLFNNIYFKFQRLASIFIFPLGVGVYLFSEFATNILLGDNWKDASPIIGVWALTSSLMIVFGFFSSEAYRAKGKPKLSFIAQLCHLIVLVPICFFSSHYGFWALVYARSLIRFQFIFVHLIFMKKYIGISIFKTLKNVLPMFISAVIMGLFGFYLKQVSIGVLWTIMSIILCSIFYFGLLFIFPSVRKDIFNLKKKLNNSSLRERK